MLQLITLLALSLMFIGFAKTTKARGLYDAMVHTTSRETASKERSLVNRLNACQRYMGDIYKAILEIINDLDVNDRLDSGGMLAIFKYLLHYDRIELWNPIIDNNPANPDMEKDRLLSTDGKYTAEEYIKAKKKGEHKGMHHDLSDVEKLVVNHKMDGGALGINVHRLAQIAYGVGKLFLKGENIDTFKDKHKDKLNAGEYDEKFLEYAKQYHGESTSTTTKTQKKQKSDDAQTEPTLEAYENGEISPKDVESMETLELWYEQLDSAGKKGAITTELNRRKRQEQD